MSDYLLFISMVSSSLQGIRDYSIDAFGRFNESFFTVTHQSAHLENMSNSSRNQ